MFVEDYAEFHYYAFTISTLSLLGRPVVILPEITTVGAAVECTVKLKL